MRYLPTAILIIFLLLSTRPCFGSHLRGAAIEYECINACTTRIYLKTYRSCASGVMLFDSLTITGSPGCILPLPVNAWSSQFTTETTPLCPGYPTTCNTPGAAWAGVGEYYWYRDYDICTGTPCVYFLNWGNCCRSPAINNLNNPGGQGLHISNTLNTTLPACNNSPEYTREPFFFACNGLDYDIHQGANDPDGDSLAYSLGPCMQSATVGVVYATGCTSFAPIPSWNISIDAETGTLHLQAVPGNPYIGVICIYMEEWRNGVLINTYVRDIHLEILACTSNDNPALSAPFNLTGTATQVGNHIFTRAGNSICFDVGSSDINAGQNLSLFWTMQLAGASFVDAFNATVTDTVTGSSAAPPTGRFCWTPTLPGLYYVMIHLQDDYCPLLGVDEIAVTLHVADCIATATATANTCPTVDFSATGCMPGPVTYLWSGGGGLSSTAQSFTHTYAAVGSYPWEVIVTSGAASDTIRDTIDVGLNTVSGSFVVGDDSLDHCAGRFEDTLVASGFSTYLWSSGATTASIYVSMSGTYWCVGTDAAGCSAVDTVVIGEHLPDIAGHVTASTTLPLVNEKIYLIRHDTMLQALIAVDSIYTDADGYYFFCNVVDTLVFLKAAPDSANYPFEMPTYADTTLFWNNAISFYPLVQVPFVHDFQTLFGMNPGGPGFIGGFVSQGANKVSAVGDPVPGLRVILREQVSGAILGHRVTDVNGYFSFAGIPLGDYEVIPDRSQVSTTNVPAISLTVQTPALDSLDFQLHRYWLELVMHPLAVQVPDAGLQFQAMPNPFGNGTRIHLDVPEDAAVEMDVFDVAGKCVEHVYAGQVEKGSHRFDMGDDLQAGFYFVRLRLNGLEKVLKVLKNE